MDSDSDFDALVAAHQRIKELEEIVAVLTNRIKMMELQNSSSVRSVSKTLNQSAASAPSFECGNMENVRTEGAVQNSPEKEGDQNSSRLIEVLQEIDARGPQGEDTLVPSANNTNTSQVQSAMKAKKGTGGDMTASLTRLSAISSCIKDESELFAALRRTKLLTRELTEANYSRCGRTDKGVSAIGQVVALRIRTNCKRVVEHVSSHSDRDSEDSAVGGRALSTAVSGTTEVEDNPMDRVAAAIASRGSEESVSSNFENEGEIDYVGVLNRVLPDDIRVVGWCPVPNRFHSRFSCLYREYKYLFVGGKLDIPSMKLAASKFLGEHDFRNFCKMDAGNVHNYRRTITEFEIVPFNESWGGRQVWVMRVKGTAFLWHQIRCMAAVLFMVGQGYESPKIVDDLLVHASNTTRKPQYTMASEKPLLLRGCGFQGLNFYCPPRAMKQLQLHLEKLLDEALVHVSLIHEALEDLPLSGVSDTEHIHKLKGMHIPLSRRQTEPSYEDRKTKFLSS
ncbi:hypothetical protein R1flu_021666 [Riccia fluitans]|uniref:Pseudouridine synthase I TruA alpha/beta domain-containing protein n=1 Tax=Riccia fluitans TaxID=41844 RepID=A0ABD1ZQ93_9MARC